MEGKKSAELKVLKKNTQTTMEILSHYKFVFTKVKKADY